MTRRQSIDGCGAADAGCARFFPFCMLAPFEDGNGDYETSGAAAAIGEAGLLRIKEDFAARASFPLRRNGRSRFCRRARSDRLCVRGRPA